MEVRAGDATEISPQVVHLVDLLKWVREGRLRLPGFQREFIWRRQEILELFDSIAKQYPIGSLILWGSQSIPASKDRIGPFQLPKYQGQTWLMLDGQQRLTTLVGVLLRGDPRWIEDLDHEDPDRWYVYFDAKSDSFTYAPRSEPLPSSFVPVPALLDTVQLITELRRISDLPKGSSGETSASEVASWIGRAENAARAIHGYRVPIIQFTADDLGVVVETFTRLNKKGRSLSQDESFSALLYGEHQDGSFQLAGEIDALQAEMIRSDFGEVDRGMLFRAVLVGARFDSYRTDWPSLRQQIRDDSRALPAAVQEARLGLARARDFLRELGVLNARMLPYAMQLVALCVFFGKCSEPTEMQQSILKRWFWYSAFSGWFGNGNTGQVRRLLAEIRDRLPRDPAPVRFESVDIEKPTLPIPLRFDLRSARVRALTCVMLGLSPRRYDGAILNAGEAARMIFEKGPEAMSTICAQVDDGNLRKSPANRTLDLAPSATRDPAKDWLVKIPPRIRDLVLESHAIDPDSISLLRGGHHDEFLNQRLIRLGQLERAFMLKMGLTPPMEQKAALSPIDNDDSPPLGMDTGEE